MIMRLKEKNELAQIYNDSIDNQYVELNKNKLIAKLEIHISGILVYGSGVDKKLAGSGAAQDWREQAWSGSY